MKDAFNGWRTNRVLSKPGIFVWMIAILFTASSFTEHSFHDLRSKQGNLLVRQIGHKLLLQAGDSTSRVVPVTETTEGTFLLSFAKELVFSHDSLMVLAKGLLSKTQFPAGYTVTVHDCKKRSIVYGFQVNGTTPDILACSGRTEPAGCYTIEFAFPDFYKQAEEKQAAIDRQTAAAAVTGGKVNKTLNDSKERSIETGSNEEIVSLKSTGSYTGEANSKASRINNTSAHFASVNVISGGMLVLLVVSLVIWRYGKTAKPVLVVNPEPAPTTGSIPGVASIGKLGFDAKEQRLLSGNEVISLTDKEFKVLELLNRTFGELIPRETLMQEVWINEGVITGRSLDMFISKLRKKLSADPALRITNVHGKGYRLESVDESIV